MPYCNTCGNLFEGRGSYCAYHNPYNISKPSSSYTKLDSDGYPVIKYRTGHGSQHHLHKSHKYKDYDNYDLVNNYDSPFELNDSALVSYDQGALQPYNNYSVYNAQQSPALAAIAGTFTRLASNYAISQMSCSLAPNGTKTVHVSANTDREQCVTCKRWFPDHERLRFHKYELPSGCEMHNVCFARDDEHYHGTRHRHDRCFVKGCVSVYRKEGNWKVTVIENHIKEWHFQ